MQYRCTHSVWVIHQVNFSMDDKSELKWKFCSHHIAQGKQAKEATKSQRIKDGDEVDKVATIFKDGTDKDHRCVH